MKYCKKCGNIQPKYDTNDMVYFMHKNRIRRGKIFQSDTIIKLDKYRSHIDFITYTIVDLDEDFVIVEDIHENLLYKTQHKLVMKLKEEISDEIRNKVLKKRKKEET